MFFILGFANKPDEYLCFNDPEYKGESLCYPHATNPDKELAARNAIKKLSENIDSPASLIKLEGEMLKKFTPEKIHNAIKKHFSWLNGESILYLLTHDNYTAVYLQENSTLYYNHQEKAFIFSYELPNYFKGASNYFGRGLKPIKTTLPSKKSNCSLSKKGIVFISPVKENLFYKEKETFCKYGNLFFAKQGNKIVVKRTDQIGSGYTTLHSDFHKFIKWLQNNQDN